MKIVLFLVFGCILFAMVYVRMAPTVPQRWHQLPDKLQNRDYLGGVLRVIPATHGQFTKLIEIISQSPRTKQIAHDEQNNMFTFETRSKWIGFPDYATVSFNGEEIIIYSRLRFGRSDLGVNKARVMNWLGQVGIDPS